MRLTLVLRRMTILLMAALKVAVALYPTHQLRLKFQLSTLNIRHAYLRRVAFPDLRPNW